MAFRSRLSSAQIAKGMDLGPQELAQLAGKELHGIVVSAGLMDKTVKVKLGGQRYEPRVQKWFKEPHYKLVHDPRNSLRKGDVVAIQSSWRESQHVRHVVKHIIAPYGDPIDERPAVPTIQERVAELAAKRQAKDDRRALRRSVDDGVNAAQSLGAQVSRVLKGSGAGRVDASP